jgi:hypothetical protein
LQPLLLLLLLLLLLPAAGRPPGLRLPLGWTLLPPLPQPRAQLSLCCLCGKEQALGHRNQRLLLGSIKGNALYCHDPSAPAAATQLAICINKRNQGEQAHMHRPPAAGC